MKKIIFISIILAGAVTFYIYTQKKTEDSQSIVTPQSQADVKANLIRVEAPLPGSVITSPLIITGKARGAWYFEASFPVVLLDGNGVEIGVSHATAHGDWMTEEFVPYVATISFEKPTTATGTLILKKDNPSGDAIRDNALLVPVQF